MSICTNKVVQYVPSGFDYKAIEMQCGNTDIHGGILQCDDCSSTRPWYVCKHGKNLSENEMACEYCNAEEE
jgi:hypothetical protein